MVSSSDPVDFNVDAPVTAKQTALTHRYKILCTKNNDGSTEYAFEYDLRPSVSESIVVGLKDLFSGNVETEDGGPSENMPDKYMPEIPDTVQQEIANVLDDELQASRIRAGTDQRIGECRIRMHLPRTYMVRLDLGKEYRS